MKKLVLVQDELNDWLAKYRMNEVKKYPHLTLDLVYDLWFSKEDILKFNNLRIEMLAKSNK